MRATSRIENAEGIFVSDEDATKFFCALTEGLVKTIKEASPKELLHRKCGLQSFELPFIENALHQNPVNTCTVDWHTADPNVKELWRRTGHYGEAIVEAQLNASLLECFLEHFPLDLLDLDDHA